LGIGTFWPFADATSGASQAAPLPAPDRGQGVEFREGGGFGRREKRAELPYRVERHRDLEQTLQRHVPSLLETLEGVRRDAAAPGQLVPRPAERKPPGHRPAGNLPEECAGRCECKW